MRTGNTINRIFVDTLKHALNVICNDQRWNIYIPPLLYLSQGSATIAKELVDK